MAGGEMFGLGRTGACVTINCVQRACFYQKQPMKGIAASFVGKYPRGRMGMSRTSPSFENQQVGASRTIESNHPRSAQTIGNVVAMGGLDGLYLGVPGTKRNDRAYPPSQGGGLRRAGFLMIFQMGHELNGPMPAHRPADAVRVLRQGIR